MSVELDHAMVDRKQTIQFRIESHLKCDGSIFDCFDRCCVSVFAKIEAYDCEKPRHAVGAVQ